MASIEPPCQIFLDAVVADKLCSYNQHYSGDRDEDNLRSGHGENHWTGTESLEWYNGHWVENSMHGLGSYFWRFRGQEGTSTTYEGNFFVNTMHGYGAISNPKGLVYVGLFYRNVRWGPGIEYEPSLHTTVGFWRARQLVRLTWQPLGPSVLPNLLSSPSGRYYVQDQRRKLARTITKIGETNSAMDLLKQCGADPMYATENWSKLYAKQCSDLKSEACYLDRFYRDYYKEKIESLKDMDKLSDKNYDVDHDLIEPKIYYAWNNSTTMIHMMKHAYMHEYQREGVGLNLEDVLNGPRTIYQQPSKHERHCRTLIMASYLGDVPTVVQLVNDEDVYADLADLQGNTAIMYATCGDQPNIIHFLAEAGGDVNSFNDACCTPLGLALMRFLCQQKGIPPYSMVQALLPGNVPDETDENCQDWLINRDLTVKDNKTEAIPKTRKKASLNRLVPRLIFPQKSSKIRIVDKSRESSLDFEGFYPGGVYDNTYHEYVLLANRLFMNTDNEEVPYIFKLNNMVNEIESYSYNGNEILKDPKPLYESTTADLAEYSSLSFGSQKSDKDLVSKTMKTIQQLLSDGADPKLVVCPQPAMVMAVSSECSELVSCMVQNGAEVNEVYPQVFNYTALDIAVSNAFTLNNLQLIEALLECGAEANHRLSYPDMHGPTLLHAVLARKVETTTEYEVMCRILESLVKFGCDPILQFKGRSAIDAAMSRHPNLIEIFIQGPRTCINDVINDANQTILVKFISKDYFLKYRDIDRFTILTKLLLYGADPLIECQDHDDNYGNIFQFAAKTLYNMERSAGDSKLSIKAGPTKKMKDPGNARLAEQDIEDYKKIQVLLVDCARLLHQRFLRAKIVKEAVSTIFKFQHRPWPMMLNQFKHRKAIGLWLNAQSCLEIWDILSTTRLKLYKNDRILKYLLCIVQFLNKKAKYHLNEVTSAERSIIEYDVGHLLKEHKIVSKLLAQSRKWKGLNNKPELVDEDTKYKICFECSLPLDSHEANILCSMCGLVYFCTITCLKSNVRRDLCHPCSDYLIKKYFSSFSEDG